MDSDIDLCLIVENNTMKRQHIKDRLTQKLEGYKIPWRPHIIEPARSDYECTLGGIAVKNLGSNILSVPFSPNRLEKSISIARRGSARSKEMAIEVLMKKLEESERHSIKNKITNTVQSEQFIKNRMHLWKKRISELLEYQEDNQD